jgi:hypothetical protein
LPLLRGLLAGERYLGKRVCLVGDPSGRDKASHDERTSFDICRQAGFTIVAAPTVSYRPDAAVEDYLLQSRYGGDAFSRKGSTPDRGDGWWLSLHPTPTSTLTGVA